MVAAGPDDRATPHCGRRPADRAVRLVRAPFDGREDIVAAGAVEFGHIAANAGISTVSAAVRLGLREQVRVLPGPGDQRPCRWQHPCDFEAQRISDFRRKSLCATSTEDVDSLFAYLFQCARQNAIVQYSVFVRPVLVDGIRVDRGKNLDPAQRAVPEGDQDAGHPLDPEEVLQVVHPAKDPVAPLRHRASPCGTDTAPEPHPLVAERGSALPEGAADANVPAKSPYVVSMEIVCAYGGFRWGFIWGITLGIRLGILLERHPLRPGKALVSGHVGGSAGIPDSLVHKPVNTSGRAGGRLASLPPLRPPLSFRHILHPLSILQCHSTLPFPPPCSWSALPFFARAPPHPAAPPTCGNRAARRSKMERAPESAISDNGNRATVRKES